MGISRRDFLKKSAMATAGVAILGLGGCAKAVSDQPVAEEKPAMKVKVACFSPTEGTKNAAAMLAAKFSDDVEYVDITNLDARSTEVQFAKDDLAIFAAPSYGGQIPMIEGLFSNIKGDGTPCIVACAFGNRAVENVYANLAKIASDNGFVVIGAIGLVTPHVFASVAKAGHSRPNVEDNKVMAEFAAKIKEKLAAGNVQAIAIEGNPDVDFAKELSVAPKMFNRDNCINCGMCASSCPTGAIDKTTLETDESKCISCQRCSFVCEYNARSYDTAVKKDFIEGKLSVKQPVEYLV
ncbi:MAG: 4Fe-4S binding protein [Erysipelotrichaceae bacterium]|nr:4Fe-4S binding protein [Erysipelotrichaceae bacterium]MDY5251287.1 4Fe-4S binding protein [Erysipelotrichaceae bacterium]